MLPAMAFCSQVRLAAIASRTKEKAEQCATKFGCDAVEGYAELLRRDDVEAVYVPLPIGLHEEWVSAALQAGKHVLSEKSLAVNLASAGRMIEAARNGGLLLVENYLFPHHNQTVWILDHILKAGCIGDIWQVRSTVSFPPLPPDNIRYRPELGGGALLDAGGYTVKVARMLLGDPLHICGAYLCLEGQKGVDIAGGAQFLSARGMLAQVSFGFRSFYQCSLEVLGSEGRLTVPRIFTPRPDYQPVVRVETRQGVEEHRLPKDNHFANMWTYFAETVRSGRGFEAEYEESLLQARCQTSIWETAERICGNQHE